MDIVTKTPESERRCSWGLAIDHLEAVFALLTAMALDVFFISVFYSG